jgi:hypothetical protein
VSGPTTGKLTGNLFTEAAEWIWENLQEDGIQMSGELVELVMETERELLIHTGTAEEIATKLEAEFEERGIEANPGKLDKSLIKAVLDWEDDFLGFAGIPRADS